MSPGGARSLGPGARTRGTPARLPAPWSPRRPHGRTVSDAHTGHRARSRPGSGAGTKGRARAGTPGGRGGGPGGEGTQHRPSKPPFFSIPPGSAPGTAGRGRSERSRSPGPVAPSPRAPPKPRESHKERGPASARLPSGRGGGRGCALPRARLKGPAAPREHCAGPTARRGGMGRAPRVPGWRGGPRSREGSSPARLRARGVRAGARGGCGARAQCLPEAAGQAPPGPPRPPILGFGCTVSGLSGRSAGHGDGTAGGRARAGGDAAGRMPLCRVRLRAGGQPAAVAAWPERTGPSSPAPRPPPFIPPSPPSHRRFHRTIGPARSRTFGSGRGRLIAGR